MLTPAQQTALTAIASAAIASQAATGVPAAMTAAQCIFESDWLTRAPGNNCFGIKVDQRGSGFQYLLTAEFLNGVWEKIPQAFETYPTLAACFADHARLIQNGVYAPAWTAYAASPKTGDALDAYIAGVARFYATDPDYAATIRAEAWSHSVQDALVTAARA